MAIGPTLCACDLSVIKIEEIVCALVEHGFVICDEIINIDLVEALSLRILGLQNLCEASVGRGGERQKGGLVRTDKSAWFDGFDESEMAYLVWMEALRMAMNQALYLGLADYEAHFSHYAKGGFYQKHLDVLRGSNKRLLTTVFYLTQNWQEGDGGELMIYDEAGVQLLQRVTPSLGKMVIFLSSKFVHEVLPSNKDRYSIAGWFRSA